MPHKPPENAYKRFCAYMAMLYAQGRTNASIAKELGVHERTIYKWVSKQRQVGPLLLLALEKLVVGTKS
jgi:transposase